MVGPDTSIADVRIKGTIAGSNEPPIPEGVTREFVGVSTPTAKRGLHGEHPVVGLYWSKKGVKVSVVFMMAHYATDFSEHYFAPLLAARGYGALGWNTRFTGAEDKFILEDGIEDLAVGTQWIKDNVGPVKIIFIGNSGGGSLMAAMCAEATTNKSIIGPDGFIFLNSHTGRADILTLMLDPSVVDETDPVKTDESLNMYNKEHGPPYSSEFIKKYRAAQVARNKKITKWVKEELKRLNDAGISDRIFPLFRNFADLRMMDGNIDPSDRPIPACFFGDPKVSNRNTPLLGRAVGLKAWLSMFSLEDSQARFEILAPKFSLPTLVIQGTADVGPNPVDARQIYDLLSSKDKELALIPGSHWFEESDECLETAVNTVQQWVDKRFH